MKAFALAVWAISIVVCVSFLVRAARNPITDRDRECARIDRELDEAVSRRRHPSRCRGPEDSPVLMAVIAHRAEELRRRG
jgi:hypothetical protein